MNNPHLKGAFNLWAEQDPSSPVGQIMRSELHKVAKNLGSAVEADIVCLMCAAYSGGFETGQYQIKQTLDPQEGKYTTFYIVWSTEDERGRRGSVVGVYTNSADAEKAKEGKGWFGSPGEVEIADGWFVGEYVMFPRVKVLREDLNVNLPKRTEEKRQAALAKLSDEEKKLLGLK